MRRKELFRFEDHAECLSLDAAARMQVGTEPQWGRMRSYRANAFLWMGDDSADRVFRLEKGQVQISYVDQRGKESVVQVVKAGEMFGEICFCPKSSAPHGVHARAMCQTQVWEMKIDGRMFADAQFSSELVATFCRKLADAENRLQILSEHDGRRRLELALLYLAKSRGVGGRLTIGHAELATFAAMTRPHTTVMLNRFRTEGLVEYVRGSSLRINAEKFSLKRRPA